MERIARVFAAILLALCLSSPVRADGKATVPDNEIADLFSAFCLKAFPDPSALDRAGEARKAAVMNAGEVAAFLHEDPGRGWTLRTSQAQYVITIEYPPYEGCVVRRMTPSGLSGVKNYLAAVAAYAAAKKGKLATMPPMKAQLPGGLDVSANSFKMLDAAGEAAETFAVALTNYHGRVPEPFRRDAGSGAGVEVRFVHQLIAPKLAGPAKGGGSL